jgi:hypothetical protein
MKINYYFAINSLIQFKNRHHLLLNKKNESVLNYLSSVELNEGYESKDVPDVTKIAEATNLPRNKVYPILYQSYLDLIESIGTKPHEISGCVHAIYIHTYDDYKDSSNLELKEEQEKKHLWAEYKLAVTPRLGEIINIDFIDQNIKYNHGVVTEIHHDIGITSQRIVIYVHPFKNYYWMWNKLKNDHINHERWLSQLRNSKTLR